MLGFRLNTPKVKCPMQRRLALKWTLIAWMLLHLMQSLQAQEHWMSFPRTISPDPSWIQEIKTTDLTGYELFEAKVTSPNPSRSLSLTLYFLEQNLGFLRVVWTPYQGSPQILSTNLYEGTHHYNQRTLLIPSSSIPSEGGTLLIQSDQPQLLIQGIRWNWVYPQNYLTALPLQETPQLILPNILLRSSEVNGQPLPLTEDSEKGGIVKTVLSPQAEMIDASTQYGIELEKLPKRALLHIQVQGLPIDTPLTVYLNQERLGEFSMEIPSLSDPGYLSEKNLFWGWRKGNFWISVEKLKTGLNTLQLMSPISNPLAIKNLVFESDYSPLKE